MVALAIQNRGIDLTATSVTEADLEDIRAEFADEIGHRCARDRDALLAGVVDRIVADLAETYLSGQSVARVPSVAHLSTSVSAADVLA